MARSPALVARSSTSRSVRWPTFPATKAWFLVAIAAFGCASKSAPTPLVDSGESLLARGHRLVDPASLAPARPELLALAQSIEASALLEPDAALSSDGHATAGELVERAWRLEAQDDDAKEALLLYKKATRDPAAPRACDASEHAAVLFAESTHDPRAEYRELYRARGRTRAASDKATAACAARIDARLSILAGIRPPLHELEAIDRGDDGGVLATASLPTTQLVRLEAWPGEDASRVVFVLDGASPHVDANERAATDATPAAVTFDFPGASASEIAPDTQLSGIVTRVRFETTPTGARATFTLAAAAHRRVFHLLEPYRVVVDVARAIPLASPRTIRRVVIDPGHGGADPGAIGAAGNREKDVNLDIAKRVVPELAIAGIEAVLTRDDDRTLSLEERTGRANASDADLFISIHCNAAESRDRHGVETYVLDTANSALAGRIAARENATSQAANAELGTILSSMRMADQATRSVKLAHLLQSASLRSLREEYPDTKDGGTHTAGFYVLVGARMPGVLFETSYLSNPSDEERLASEAYRQDLAQAIATSITQYRDGL